MASKSHILVQLLAFLFFNSIHFTHSTQCIKTEREALLKLKSVLQDPANLYPWAGENCCSWAGVFCHKRTVRVVRLDLDLSGGEFGGGFDGPLPSGSGHLCNLQSLRFSYMTNVSLDLNQLREVFSGCVKNSLTELDFSNSQFIGTLPDWLGEIKNLKSLDLSHNSIYGSIPESLSQLSSLETLDISYNKLNVTVAENIGQLSSLVSLDLSANSLNGVISEAHFANLAKLKFLDLSSNSLGLEVASNWVPPFKLHYLYLGSCQIGPQFPQWLQTQHNLYELIMSNAGISDAMPEWIGSLSSQLSFLDLSNNQISGRLPGSLLPGNDHSVYSEGLVPKFTSNAVNNSFSELVPLNIWEMPILDLDLSTNNLSGNIPSSLCKLVNLTLLRLSNNHLSGELPNCWDKMSKLEVLSFSNNNFSGRIPSSICSQKSLEKLHLSKNGMTGELPSNLQNCTNLKILNLGNNKFTGKIPSWVGEKLSSLWILSLRSNKLDGDIPHLLSQLTYLQILDLSHNALSGVIPRSFGNFSAMVYRYKGGIPIQTDANISLNWKGEEIDYNNYIPLLIMVDLSHNNLFGNMPGELADLTELQSLNLSENHLTGVIPVRIGNLTQLQSLDLSSNAFSGEIPQSLATLTFLSCLNLSYNSLSGSIPTGPQLQTLTDPLIYVGNHDLCGFPLPKCGEEHMPPISSIGRDEENEVEDDQMWIYVGIGPGFGVGIWIFSWIILFKKPWRDALFHWVDNMGTILHLVN